MLTVWSASASKSDRMPVPTHNIIAMPNVAQRCSGCCPSQSDIESNVDETTSEPACIVTMITAVDAMAKTVAGGAVRERRALLATPCANAESCVRVRIRRQVQISGDAAAGAQRRKQPPSHDGQRGQAAGGPRRPRVARCDALVRDACRCTLATAGVAGASQLQRPRVGSPVVAPRGSSGHSSITDEVGTVGGGARVVGRARRTVVHVSPGNVLQRAT